MLSPLRPDDALWMTSACRLDTFLCDAAFSIADSFYYGLENNLAEGDWETARVPLPVPALPSRLTRLVFTVDLLGREDELIAHYERLIAIAEAHGKAKSLHKPFPYFTVSPIIIAGGQAVASFDWHDDVPDTKEVLEVLATSGDGGQGIIWDDQEQSWEILIATAGELAYFVEWDGEGPPPAASAYAVDAATLARQAAEALERLDAIHARLKSAFGRDQWTYQSAASQHRVGTIRRMAGKLANVVRRR